MFRPPPFSWFMPLNSFRLIFVRNKGKSVKNTFGRRSIRRSFRFSRSQTKARKETWAICANEWQGKVQLLPLDAGPGVHSRKSWTKIIIQNYCRAEGEKEKKWNWRSILAHCKKGGKMLFNVQRVNGRRFSSPKWKKVEAICHIWWIKVAANVFAANAEPYAQHYWRLWLSVFSLAVPR